MWTADLSKIRDCSRQIIHTHKHTNTEEEFKEIVKPVASGISRLEFETDFITVFTMCQL